MNHIPLADISALAPVLAYLRNLGVDVNQHLDAMNISPELLAQEEGLITKAQGYGFMRRCEAREGLHGFGYHFGGKRPLNQLGKVGAAVLQTATLKDAIDTFARLLPHYMGCNRVWLEADGDQIWLCNATPDGFALQRGGANHNTVRVLIDLVRLAAGPDWRPQRVKIEEPPSSAHCDVEELTEAEVVFNPEITAIAFPARLLPKRLSGGTSSEPAFAVMPLPDDALPCALRHLLTQKQKLGQLPDMYEAADMIGTSRRTLQRRLAENGVTYQHLLDRARFDRADELLRDPSNTVQDISAALGYSCPNNFIRAFRRISGCTPREYRTRAKALQTS